MMSHGAASLVAAREVVEKGKRLAARWKPPLPTSRADGIYRVAGTDRSVDLMTLASNGALDTLTGLPATRAFPSGAHVAEVEIDPETGVTEVVNYVAVDDCGVVVTNHTPSRLRSSVVAVCIRARCSAKSASTMPVVNC